jgi:hypothetical protein
MKFLAKTPTHHLVGASPPTVQRKYGNEIMKELALCEIKIACWINNTFIVGI